EPGDVGALQRQQPWALGDLFGQQSSPGPGDPLLPLDQLITGQARDAGDSRWSSEVGVIQHYAGPAQSELYPALEPCPAAAYSGGAGLELPWLCDPHVIQHQPPVSELRTEPALLFKGRLREVGIFLEGRLAEPGAALKGSSAKPGTALEYCRSKSGGVLEACADEPSAAPEAHPEEIGGVLEACL